MDFLSNLFPGVPSLELDPTSQYQNVTLLQETFIGAFLGTFIANLAAQTVRNILERDKPSKTSTTRQTRYRLENDPSCGVTTGGQPECWWKCYDHTVFYNGESITLLHPPSCLSDCYAADHCLSSLIADYHAAGGICRGTWLDTEFPGLFNVSDQTCGDLYDESGGLCSERTKELLRDQENCVIPIFSSKKSVFVTTSQLINSMCDRQTWYNFEPSPVARRVNTKRSVNEVTNNRKERFFLLLKSTIRKINETRKPTTKETLQPRQQEHLVNKNNEDADGVRLIPIDLIRPYNGVLTAHVPPLENTKHRYPWICSLRSVGEQPSHLCGVTLLSRPPGPTVLVTSAHCVYICKSEEGRLVPNCCCPNVGPGLCTDTEDCGTNATTVVMTGAEAEVKCGEWDTATDTEEDYNVILPIVNITVHPDFDISRGEQNSQFVANDIAVIKVDDTMFEDQSRNHNIYPACLPSSSHDQQKTAIHSGWSKPPPLDYVINNAPLHEPFYQDFFKQWHYKMNITKCEDPKTYPTSEIPLNYPSNSYYPPGTVCAVEKLGDFCPTSGESGSPLMVTDNEGKMIAEGINSFIKGCSNFEFRGSDTYSFLLQESENPAVYTKLSCYLPWVAAQYGMDFTPVGDPDPACLTGNGNITEVTAEVCRTNPFSYSERPEDGGNGNEAECLFPFTLNGESHDTCIMGEESDFTRPVFRCPIRTVKGAGPNGTDYIDYHLTGGLFSQGQFCPTNSVGSYYDNDLGQYVYEWNDDGPVYGPTGELELDPDIPFPTSQCSRILPLFGTCKNNCPGVNFPVVAGGFALLAVSGVASNAVGAGAAGAAGALATIGAGGIAPVLGGLGLVGVAGAAGMGLMAMAECGGPMLCVAASGQCCFLGPGIRTEIGCPASC